VTDAIHTEPERTEPPAGLAALRRVLQFMAPYRRMFILAILVLGVRAAAQLLTIYYVSEVLGATDGGVAAPIASVTDSLAGAAKEAVAPSRADTLQRMTIATSKVLAFGLLSVFCYSLGLYLWDRAAQKTIRDIRDRMFAHVNRLGVDYFDRRRSGDTTSRLINDTQYLRLLTDSDVREMFAAPVQVLFSLYLMLTISWRVTVWGFLVSPLVIAFMAMLGRVVRRTTRGLQEDTAGLTGLLAESIQGVRVVRIFGLQRHEKERFHDQNQRIYRNAMRAARAHAAALPGNELLGYIGFAVVIWVGMYEIVSGRLTLAWLITLALLMQRVGTYLSKTGRNWARLQELGSVCDRITDFLSVRVEDDRDEQKPSIEVGNAHVVFDRVSFGYREDVPVLHDVSLEIKPGEVVAVVGESGSGKSTLASLLARLYDPTGGRILVDGQSIVEHSRASLRSHMGVVLQDSFLFTGAVRWNIWLGNQEADDAAIVEAARVANADGFIDSLPEGYDTIVGERGTTLSGGQRQRIAIARAVLRDPAMLILDEATSSLDSEAEKVVQVALNRLMENRTTLAIAHRLSTIRDADRIYVLDHGRIVESGAHEDLLERDGYYARLWRLQVGQPASEDRGAGAS
jgi:subfamily B ATP-binding cassette protein MsbA